MRLVLFAGALALVLGGTMGCSNSKTTQGSVQPLTTMPSPSAGAHPGGAPDGPAAVRGRIPRK